MKTTKMLLLWFATAIFMVGCSKQETAMQEENTIQQENEIEESKEEPEKLWPNLIEEQSFDVTLDGFGEVMFASFLPEDKIDVPEFYLIQEDEKIYHFPNRIESNNTEFQQILAVSFRDFNMDGYDDVILLLEFIEDNVAIRVPYIYLRNNSDSMFYLDFPEQTEFQIAEGDSSEDGYYRDLALESFLMNSKDLHRISDFQESWLEYIEYLDEQKGILSIDKQLKIIASQRDTWLDEDIYFDESSAFTLLDMDSDGKLELIVSSFGGTGHYTYSDFYGFNQENQLVLLQTSFEEGESQPDIMVNQWDVYRNITTEGMHIFFVVQDNLKVSMTEYYIGLSSISLRNHEIIQEPLVTKKISYVGENLTEEVEIVDNLGNTLTEEEFLLFPESYYNSLNYTKSSVSLSWTPVSDIWDKSEEEMVEFLFTIL